MLYGLAPANMPGIHFSCSIFSVGFLELAKWMCNLWVGMLMSWVSLPSWTTAFDGLVSASCEACSGQGETERDPYTATASLPQELPALPMTFMFKDRELDPRQNIWSWPTGKWVLHPRVIATVGTPWPKYSCRHLSLRVPLLASSQVILVSQLFLFVGSHFPSTLTKGTFTEAQCFPASPEKRL